MIHGFLHFDIVLMRFSVEGEMNYTSPTNSNTNAVRTTYAVADWAEDKYIYDDAWAENYIRNVRSWGYNMPEVVAATLRRLVLAGAGAQQQQQGAVLADFPVLDAGAGPGLSGEALIEEGFVRLTGIDLVPELVEIAKTKNIYERCEVADLSRPLAQFKDGEFGAATVVGVMTYLEPDGFWLDEVGYVVDDSGDVQK